MNSDRGCNCGQPMTHLGYIRRSGHRQQLLAISEIIPVNDILYPRQLEALFLLSLGVGRLTGGGHKNHGCPKNIARLGSVRHGRGSYKLIVGRQTCYRRAAGTEVRKKKRRTVEAKFELHEHAVGHLTL